MRTQLRYGEGMTKTLFLINQDFRDTKMWFSVKNKVWERHGPWYWLRPDLQKAEENKLLGEAPPE